MTTRSEVRAKEKRELRSINARRSEKVDSLRVARDREVKQLWDRWQERIAAAQRRLTK